MPENPQITWPELPPNDRLDVQALKTEIAIVRHINSEQNTKIDRIDANVSQLPALFAEVKVSINTIETRVRELEVRGETIDANKHALAVVGERIGVLERAMETLVIKAGPFRIRALEWTLYTTVFLGTGGAIYGLLWQVAKAKLGF